MKSITIDYRPRVAGLSLMENTGKRDGVTYTARCYCTRTDKHNRRTFDTKPEAIAWGREEMSRITLGQSRGGALSIAALLPDFIAYELKVKGVSPHHARDYELTLTRAMEEARVNNLKDDLLVDRIQDWLNVVKDGKRRVYGPDSKHISRRNGGARPLSAAKKGRMVTLIKGFGEWVRIHRGHVCNPFERLRKPPRDAKIKDVFTVAECRRLVSDEALRDPDGLYFAVLIYSGMRQQEAAWLRSSHIQYRDKRFSVLLEDDTDRAEGQRLLEYAIAHPSRNHTVRKVAPGKQVKRNRERHALLFDELAEILSKVDAPIGGYVFPQRYRLWQSQDFTDALARVCKRVNVTIGDRTTHSIRHTNCCMSLASGIDSLMVKNHLGHTSTTTTSGYAGHALSMKEECQSWRSQIRLRPIANDKLPTSEPGKMGIDARSCDGEPISPEDDISDYEYIILPDISPIVERLYLIPPRPWEEIENPRVGCSSQPEATTQSPEVKEVRENSEKLG